ncbi:hypothetical protein ALC56_14989, partial [Trachymyrmex septentrionalis]
FIMVNPSELKQIKSCETSREITQNTLLTNKDKRRNPRKKTAGNDKFNNKENVYGETKNVYLKNTLHGLDLRMNLMSIAWITNNNFKIVFNKTNAEVIDGSIKLTADRVGDLYYICENSREHCKIATDTESTSSNTQKTFISWHRLLGHINFKDFLDAERSGIISEIKIGQRDSKTQCDICIHGKITRTFFPKKSNWNY